MEMEVMSRNKCHLQQMEIKGGVGPVLKELISEYGTSEAADHLLKGTYQTEQVVIPAFAT